MSCTFSRDDRVDRPNPKLPPLHKIDEVLFINEPEPIRPDNVFDGDSITSNPEDILDNSDINLLAPADDDYVSPASEEESSGDQSSSGESSPHGFAQKSPRAGDNA